MSIHWILFEYKLVWTQKPRYISILMILFIDRDLEIGTFIRKKLNLIFKDHSKLRVTAILWQTLLLTLILKYSLNLI